MWSPLCSHLSLNEAIRGDLNVSPDELEIISALRKSRLAKNALERSKKYRAKKTKEDPVGFLKKNSASKQIWTTNHRPQIVKTAARERSRKIDNKEYHCSDCNLSLQSQAALDTHLTKQSHKDSVAGGILKKAPSKSAVSVAAVRVATKANGDHHCTPYSKDFNNDWELQRHLKGKKLASMHQAYLDSQN